MKLLNEKALSGSTARIYLFPIMKSLLLAVSIAMFGDANAMYQCITGSGQKSFQDQPCAVEAAPKERSKTASTSPPVAAASAQMQRMADQIEEDLKKALKKHADAAPARAAAAAAYQRARPITSREPMPFEQCVAVVRNTIQALPPAQWQNVRFVVNGPSLKITRICTVDGSVLITCSAAENAMLTTQNNERGSECR